MSWNQTQWRDNHMRWLQARLSSPDAKIYIAETEGQPFGQIRFEKTAEDFLLNYSIAAGFRGKGLGKPLVSEGTARLRAELDRSLRIIAMVKKDNPASLRVFRSLGFAELPSADDREETTFTITAA